MSFLDRLFNRQSSAQIAKNRLSIVLAHERSTNLPYLNEMRDEIVAVIKKYTHSDESRINFKTDGNQNINCLEIEITLN